MKDGNLDGGFCAIYTEQGPLTAKGYADALAFARGRSDLIDKTIAANSDAIASALTAADALRLNTEGKLIAFKSLENSYPLGERSDEHTSELQSLLRILYAVFCLKKNNISNA